MESLLRYRLMRNPSNDEPTPKQLQYLARCGIAEYVALEHIVATAHVVDELVAHQRSVTVVVQLVVALGNIRVADGNLEFDVFVLHKLKSGFAAKSALVRMVVIIAVVILKVKWK